MLLPVFVWASEDIKPGVSAQGCGTHGPGHVLGLQQQKGCTTLQPGLQCDHREPRGSGFLSRPHVGQSILLGLISGARTQPALLSVGVRVGDEQ
jgi:hypothetical protein